MIWNTFDRDRKILDGMYATSTIVKADGNIPF